ncbi:hypothetical protein HK100_007124 [Physocladia obscura]|uniref:STI1 domain-containing protein n=1 Tax=Physocladia obscura TaxID=109957 RepID=A0AAD5T6M9_9FUNG|nr:hypothetical protein HK100_007124 [Physocladia obscura]
MTAKGKDPKKLAFAIYEYFSDSIADGTIKPDDVEMSMQCISEAFGFDFSDETQKKALSIKPTSLVTIFDVFANTQKRVADNKLDEIKAKVEALKNQGNKLVAEKKYQQAIAKYTQAIELAPDNAVYYANRAAAYSQDDDHANAVEDSKRAIEVDPSYSKAYSRMGHAHFCLGNYEESVEAYETGLKLDPSNAAMKQNLAAAQQKITENGGVVPGASSGGGAGGNPFAGMPGLGGAGGGMPDIASMLGNPDFMNMASKMMNNPAISQMMKNPAVAEMAQKMMQDPSALSGMMQDPNLMSQLGALNGGAGAPGGSGSSEGKKKKKK